MTATATRLVQESFPVGPLGGTLGAGLYTVEWKPSKIVWNVTTGEVINHPQIVPINPVTGAAGWKDDTRSGAVGAALACCDDPNNSATDWSWVRTPRVAGIPQDAQMFYISTATADPVLVANLVPVSGGTVTTGLTDITSSTLTVTHPAPGIVNIEDTGGGGGGASLGSATPLSDSGTGVVGTSAFASHEDHRHPLDSAYATAAALTTEQTARAAGDTTNATNLSTHAALTTSAHGGIVANTDARLSDARTPTAHASTHISTGSDPIAGAVAGGAAGLLTGADKTKLDGLAALTAKGDLLSYSTVPVRVGVGANGTRPVADSTQSAGLRWEAIVKEFSWTATGYAYLQAGVAMTVDQAVTPNGTLAYDKASAGALGTFSSTSLPCVLAAGDVLRVNATALANGYACLVLKRTS